MMITEVVNGIHAFRFCTFDEERVQVRVITRQGGVSPAPYSSLNLGGTVRDDNRNVLENKMRLLTAYRIKEDQVFDVWQVHSSDWVYADSPRFYGEPHQKADIILTDKPGLGLLMRFADCVPLFLYDTRLHAAAIGHAGWQGTAKNVAKSMVVAMSDRFGSVQSDLLAAIGPAICMEHYQVGEEVYGQFNQFSYLEDGIHRKTVDGTFYLDLKKINAAQFVEQNVKSVENSEVCTACEPENWFSHRRDHGKTGRFGAFIRLE